MAYCVIHVSGTIFQKWHSNEVHVLGRSYVYMYMYMWLDHCWMMKLCCDTLCCVFQVRVMKRLWRSWAAVPPAAWQAEPLTGHRHQPQWEWWLPFKKMLAQCLLSCQVISRIVIDKIYYDHFKCSITAFLPPTPRVVLKLISGLGLGNYLAIIWHRFFLNLCLLFLITSVVPEMHHFIVNSNHLWDHKKEMDGFDVQSLLPLLAVLLALADSLGITGRVPKSYHK